MRKFLGRALPVLAVLFTATHAPAQQVGLRAYSASCGEEVRNEPGQVAIDCSNYDAFASAAASATSGKIGVFAAAQGSWSQHTPLSLIPVAEADARWRDRMSWSAPGSIPAVAVFSMAITGHLTTGLSTVMYGAGANAHALFTWSAWSDGSPYLPSYSGYAQKETRVGLEYYHSDLSNAQRISVDLAGASYLEFEYFLRARAWVDNPQGMAGTAQALSDFSHSASISGLQFLDEGGNDITEQVSYSFENGTQIHSADATVTPEPVSMALLGTGLAGLGAVRRRRREQAEAA